ncbi:unnamed protein product, partial [Rotaria sp. Silwood2]
MDDQRDFGNCGKKSQSLPQMAKLSKNTIEYWDELSLEIEKAVKQHDLGTAYAMLRRLKGGRAKIEEMPIWDKYGNLLTNSNDRLDRWREYFSDLLNVPSTTDPTILHQIQPPPIASKEEQRQNKPPTLVEVEEAIRRMKSGKAAGHDGLPADVIKAGGRTLARRLHQIFVDVWEDEEAIDDWSTAILIRLFKNKGDKKDCGNYRDSKAMVQINGERSESFDIETGVLQGGIPSPILFNVFFDFVIRRVLEKLAALNVTGVKLSY